MGLFGKKKSKEPTIEDMLTQADVERLVAGLGSQDAHRAVSDALRANNSDPRVVEALIAALKDDDYDVRATVTMILATSADPRIEEPLIAALKDEVEGVRLGAAMAVGTIVAKTPGGDPRALGALKNAQAVEEHPAVKDQMLKIILAISEEPLGSNPGADPTYAMLRENAGVGQDPVARDALLKIMDAVSD